MKNVGARSIIRWRNYESFVGLAFRDMAAKKVILETDNQSIVDQPHYDALGQKLEGGDFPHVQRPLSKLICGHTAWLTNPPRNYEFLNQDARGNISFSCLV